MIYKTIGTLIACISLVIPFSACSSSNSSRGSTSKYSRSSTSYARAKKCENLSPWKTVECINTWKEAKYFIQRNFDYADDIDTYGEEDYVASFAQMLRTGRDDCDGGAVAGAALLMDNPQYGVSGMYMEGSEGAHWVALIRDKHIDGYGSLGMGSYDMVKPTKDSPTSVFREINANYDYIYNHYNIFHFEFSRLVYGGGDEVDSGYYKEN